MFGGIFRLNPQTKITMDDQVPQVFYEIEADWESGDILTTDHAATIPALAVQPDRLYRVRTKMKDTAGRWSRWSNPVEFTTSQPDLSEYIDGLRITEFMYHPPEPSGAETLVSTNRDDFEYIELMNVGATPLDLLDVRFTKGVDFDFSEGLVDVLGPGELVLIVKNIAAFEARYGDTWPVVGEYTDDNLSNGGERLKLSFGAGITIHDIDEYNDTAPWPTLPDGDGFSLTLIHPDSIPGPDHNDPANWRPSTLAGGSPGTLDAMPYAAWRTANGVTDDLSDDDRDGLVALMEFALGSDHQVASSQDLPAGGIGAFAGDSYLTIQFRRKIGADDLTYIVEFSSDLTNWSAGGVLVSTVPHEGGGILLETWRAPVPLSSSDLQYARLRVLR